MNSSDYDRRKAISRRQTEDEEIKNEKKKKRDKREHDEAMKNVCKRREAHARAFPASKIHLFICLWIGFVSASNSSLWLTRTLILYFYFIHISMFCF